MKRQKKLCSVFFIVTLLTGAAFTGCDDGVVIEDAKFIKLNNLNISDSGWRRYNGDYQERPYSAVYSIGLTANSSGEHPVYGNPDANVVINNKTNHGTATIVIYELITPEITGDPWKGLGEYFIFVGLLYENQIDYYISKHKVRIRRAITEIGFEDNFVFKEQKNK